MTSRVVRPDDIVDEATIEDLQRGLLAGEFNCVALVDAYLGRIARWDKRGPMLRAVLALNPAARKLAANRDAALAAEGRFSGPLHGVVVALKDNCNTTDMPTTGGSLSLQGIVPTINSTVSRKLSDAGAIVLAKTNLHEFALSGTTVSSLGGQTLNPYDLTRTPGGSSGGSGVAAAMSFATVAIGTDTVNSIRSPASANCLVGLRPTRGLISRAGVMPVSQTQDSIGPMARTVSDVARVLEVLAGYDTDDPVTARAVGRIPASYYASLDHKAFEGRRIGVLRRLLGDEPRHLEVNTAMARAVQTMRDGGAQVLEVDDPCINADALLRDGDVQKWEFKPLFEAYLRALPQNGVRTLGDVLACGAYHQETLHEFLVQSNDTVDSEHDCGYLGRLAAHDRLRDRVLGLMAEHALDALAYPLQKCLVVPVGAGGQAERNGILAALTGFPALNVPMGFSTPDLNAPLGVPMGMDLLARPFDEPLLLGLGYAFEQRARVRKPPLHTLWPD
ncbi:amidase family protein [Pollutimonas harenae]|uniref:Amidase n=1 Tax=Pollutimonas harenae TaxID=657015 RepID=A0A853GRC0_9BURK|nr:amidase family protein [Pollutimonas harenae]NYT85628.1 amidase [Pollutimonas harenae]TEA70706.1 amidase [Pollutimonas harenae]